MAEITTIFNIIEWVANFLVLVAVYFMIKIGKVTGWFRAWGILVASFILIVIRRAISAYAPYTSIRPQLGYANSILLLIISVFFVIGFYKLYLLFKKQQH